MSLRFVRDPSLVRPWVYPKSQGVPNPLAGADQTTIRRHRDQALKEKGERLERTESLLRSGNIHVPEKIVNLGNHRVKTVTQQMTHAELVQKVGGRAARRIKR
jgi:hypothetical protein